MKRLALILVTFYAMNALAQGLHWQQKTTGSPMGDQTTDCYAVPKKFKVATSDGNVTIMRLDKEIMWNINTKEKTYDELTFAEFEELMKLQRSKTQGAFAKMREQLKDMPEEQRKMMEKMMGGNMPTADAADGGLDVKKTGEKKTIGGYACTKYVLMQGKDEFMTMWMTKDVKGFDALANDWKEFSKRMSGVWQQFGKGSTDAFTKMDGFPMETIMNAFASSGNPIVVTTTKVEKASIAASEFDLPSGYKKEKSKLKEAVEEMDKED